MTTFAKPALTGAALTIALLAGCAHSGAPGPRLDDSAAAGPSRATTVTGEELRRRPGEPLEQALIGRFPGVLVSRTPDGGISVRIRGVSSILGSNEPLYVIDGIPVQPGPRGSLFGLTAQDIETIEVLKDAASTAMYGVRGANGVIVITTRRP